MALNLYLSPGALGLAGIILAVGPVALAASLRHRAWGLRTRVGFAVAGTLALAVVLLWDVALTTHQMAELCPSAGARIHRTVKASGYLTNFETPSAALARGFSYLEVSSPGRISVYVKAPSGEVERLDTPRRTYTPKSRYEHEYMNPVPLPGYLNISVMRSVVRDRASNELLAEAVTYRAHPGWLDRNTFELLHRAVWPCPGDAGRPHQEIMRDVIYPQ